VECRLWLRDRRDLTPALARCRRLLDLDADPVRIDAVLAADPVLARVLALGRGRRVPRAPDGPELAVRAVLGQQVSTAAARTHAARLVRAHGEAVDDPDGGLTHLFPDTAALAGLDPSSLALPRARRRTMAALLAALTGGPEQEGLDLDVGADPARARAALTALPGFGPWTVETILMRALGDDDAFLPTDLGVAAAASRLGLPPTPAALRRYAERWRPWRAYAVQYLWATGEHAVNRLPPADVVLSPS
jgi:AraC family transcriptional regulator of adaptative response / DNA-3-methyladenine glycosylase II